MSQTLYGYPQCCTGSVLFGWNGTKEKCLEEAFNTLRNADRDWKKDGHCSAVTTNGQRGGNAALKEIGFTCVNPDNGYKSGRHSTLTYHWAISTEDLIKWYRAQEKKK
jgi:hypothetical protein